MTRANLDVEFVYRHSAASIKLTYKVSFLNSFELFACF